MSRIMVGFDDVELVQQGLHREVLEQAMFIHLLLLEVLFRCHGHTPHAQPLFQIAQELLDEVLAPVDLDSGNSIF